MAAKFNIKGSSGIASKGLDVFNIDAPKIIEQVVDNNLKTLADTKKNELVNLFQVKSEDLEVVRELGGYSISPTTKKVDKDLRLIEYGNDEKSPKPLWRRALVQEQNKGRSSAKDIQTQIMANMKAEK